MSRIADIKSDWEKVYGDVRFTPPYRTPMERLLVEIGRLEALVETLQPDHHYMTKMGSQLQDEVTRLHNENKLLVAKVKELS